jgi:hypothetical protein
MTPAIRTAQAAKIEFKLHHQVEPKNSIGLPHDGDRSRTGEVQIRPFGDLPVVAVGAVGGLVEPAREGARMAPVGAEAPRLQVGRFDDDFARAVTDRGVAAARHALNRVNRGSNRAQSDGRTVAVATTPAQLDARACVSRRRQARQLRNVPGENNLAVGALSEAVDEQTTTPAAAARDEPTHSHRSVSATCSATPTPRGRRAAGPSGRPAGGAADGASRQSPRRGTAAAAAVKETSTRSAIAA